MEILENIQQKRMLESVENGVISKFPLLGVTMANLKFEPSKDIQTAGTDGEKIIYSPKFIEGLTYDERIFFISHEVMHNAFDHIMRNKDKDPKLWNYATDAVINQMLKAANLPLPQGGIDMPEAAGKSAEEIYEILQEKKQQQQNQHGKGIGQHNMWREAIKQAEIKSQNQSQGRQNNNQQHSQTSMSSSDMEKMFTKANNELKNKIGEQIREKLREQKEEMLENYERCGGYTSEFDDVGEATAILSWKKILKRELDKNEDRWAYRRADEDNDYQARIETLEVEDYPETEIILDTSGSISVSLLKNFLRQVKTLLNDSKINVGTFSGEFHGFVEIKQKSDIDNLRITVGGPTNFDAASRAFTKRKNVNKICFTDGLYDGSTRIQDKRKDIIWISFENPNFKPDNGKVIFVPKSQINLQRDHDEIELTI